MSRKITIEVDPQHEGIVRRVLALAEEMEQLALTAPDGQVFDICEEAVVEKGRKLQGVVLSAAVARRIEAIEKKGAASGLHLGTPAGKPRAQGTLPHERRRHRRLHATLREVSLRRRWLVGGRHGTGR